MSRNHQRDSLSTDSSEDLDVGVPIASTSRNRHMDDFEYQDGSIPTISRPSGYTNGTMEKHSKSQDRSRSSRRTRDRNGLRTRDLIKLLISEERFGESKDITRVLSSVQDRLESETLRANEAERSLSQAYDRFRAVNQDRIKAEENVKSLQDELQSYKLHLETAQATIKQANEMIQQIEKEKFQAEDVAEKARAAVRKYQEEKLINDARKQGWDEGVEEGKKEGYRGAWNSAYRQARREALRELDDYLERQGLPPVEEGEYEDFENGEDENDVEYDYDDGNAGDREILSPIDIRAQGQGPPALTTPVNAPVVPPAPRPSSSQSRPRQSNTLFARLGRRNNRQSSRASGIDSNVEINRNAPDVGSIVDNRPVVPGVTPMVTGSTSQALVDDPDTNTSMRMPEPNFNPDPSSVPPIRVQSRSPSPRFRAVEIPPDGYIPVVGPDGSISLPPPHELMNPRISPHPSMASLRTAAQEAEEVPPALPPKQSSPRHRYQQSIPESLASTVTSGYDLVNSNRRGSPRLGTIVEQDIPISPNFNRPSSRASNSNALGFNNPARSPSIRAVNMESGPSGGDGFAGGFVESPRRPLSRSQQIANELRYAEAEAELNNPSFEDPRLMSPRSSVSARSGPSSGPPRPRKLNMPSPLAPGFGLGPEQPQYSRSRAGSVTSNVSGRGRPDSRRPMGASSTTSHDDINITVEPPSRDESLASRAITPMPHTRQMLTPETRAEDLQPENQRRTGRSPNPVIPVIPPDPSAQETTHIPFIPPSLRSGLESIVINQGLSQVPFAPPYSNSHPTSVLANELPPNFVPQEILPSGGTPRGINPQLSRSPSSTPLQFPSIAPILPSQSSIGDMRGATGNMDSWDESGRQTPRQGYSGEFSNAPPVTFSPRPVSPRPISPRPLSFVGNTLPPGFMPTSGPGVGPPPVPVRSRPASPNPFAFPGIGQTLGFGPNSGPVVPGLPFTATASPRNSTHIEFPTLNTVGPSTSPRLNNLEMLGNNNLSNARSPAMRGSVSLGPEPGYTLGRDPSHHFRTSSFGSSGIPHFASINFPPAGGPPRTLSPRPTSPFQPIGNAGMNPRPVSPLPTRPNSFVESANIDLQRSLSPRLSNSSLFPNSNVTANIAMTQPIPSRPVSRNSNRFSMYDNAGANVVAAPVPSRPVSRNSNLFPASNEMAIPNMSAPLNMQPTPSRPISRNSMYNSMSQSLNMEITEPDTFRNSVFIPPNPGRQSPRPSMGGSIGRPGVDMPIPVPDPSRRNSRVTSRASSRSSRQSSSFGGDPWGLADPSIPYPQAPASPALSNNSVGSHIRAVPLPTSSNGANSRRNSRVYPRTPGLGGAQTFENEDQIDPPAGFVQPLRHSDSRVSISSNRSFQHYNPEQYRDAAFLASEQSMFMPNRVPG